MTKPNATLAAMTAGAALAAILAAAPSPTAAQSLQYGNYLPPTHATNRFALEPLFEKVAEETDNKVRIRLHPGGSLVSGKETLEAIRSGLIDGGFVVSLYVANAIPLNTALSDLALLATDPVSVIGALNETVLLDCQECLDEYLEHNLVYLGSYATTPYKLMCKEPIEDLDDIKGRKMRAAGDVYGRWAAAMGGVPVTIENSEAYEAMERGQLDCVIGSVAWLQTLSLWDTAKHVVDLPMGAYFGGAMLAFNKSTWDSLDDQAKSAIVENTPAALARLALGYVEDDETVLAQASEQGVGVSEPPVDLISLLADYQKSEIDNAIAKAEERGADNPAPVVDAFLANLEKWKGIAAEVGDDVALLEEALQREIYSKINP